METSGFGGKWRDGGLLGVALFDSARKEGAHNIQARLFSLFKTNASKGNNEKRSEEKGEVCGVKER